MSVDSDLISIIVPVYNSEKYIDECLSSIMMQTYFNLDVVIIDDGSTDGSADICTNFCNNDNRFRYFKIRNSGSSYARNIGLQKALGSYIAFIDSDDYVEPDFIEILYNNIKKEKADISMCDFLVNGQPEHTDWGHGVFEKKQIFPMFINGGCCNRIMNKLYKKDVVGSVLFPLEHRNIKEDAVFTASVLERCSLFVRIKEAKYNYRINDNSLSRKKVHQKDFYGMLLNDLEKDRICLRNANLDDRLMFKVFTDIERIVKLSIPYLGKKATADFINAVNETLQEYNQSPIYVTVFHDIFLKKNTTSIVRHYLFSDYKLLFRFIYHHFSFFEKRFS